MLALTLNPGFVLILAALLVLVTPRGLSAMTIAGAALLALWMLLDYEFGAAAAMAQMGLPVVLLDLDALNRSCGIALLIALIVISLYSGARRNRFEDAAILLLAGGAVSALFLGDLVSFVAAAALAGLAAAALVFVSPLEGAGRAGVRLLMWHGLEGLLFLVGVAFHLSGGAQSAVIARLDVGSIGGGFIFAALMIRVGAPFAHVWLKDVVSHASPIGGAALSAFASMIGVYALARFFPAEQVLVPIGAAMIVIGAAFAAAEDDLRRAAAYGLTAQTGISVALIGVGSPLALAGAEGGAFAAIFAFLTLQMALGNVVHRLGHARASGIVGLARLMPITTALIFIGGLAVASAPGLALFAAHAVSLEAVAEWELRGLWVLIAGASAVLFVTLTLRPALAAFQPAPAKPKRGLVEAPFSMLLGTLMAAFFCVAIGLAPRWLYDLMPTELSFQPYAPDRLAQQFELLSVAGAAFLGLRAAGLAPRERQVRLLDIDALYRGPLAGVGRWLGVVMLRVYGAGREALAAASRRAGAGLSALLAGLDRPYHFRAAGLAHWLAIAALVAAMLFARPG
jgi:multicomponent Na+:H+ antiporter subunit D